MNETIDYAAVIDRLVAAEAALDRLAADRDADRREIAELKAREQRREAELAKLQREVPMLRQRVDTFLPINVLAVTRTAQLEERVFTPDEALRCREYWTAALQQLGVQVDPLNLPLK